ncbi:protein kinase [Natroniella acetigena]|uniref:serine/threonine-protein kinase n=1 Tax=Natroniella acetigena TaxID=52004 RepID=UPI00200A5CF1|nr:serine/threonine-protein kinase [Natroniella acetigena]MCK8828255.1 protein kinase [Natroniella acetigena]
MSRFKPEKDKKIGDKYILKEFLGDGSYGYVWKAMRLEDGEVVALKIPKKQESGDKVLKEGSKLQGHTHPHIIDIKWMGRVNGVFVIEMEYFESHTLAEEIREYGTIKPRLFSNLYDIFFQVLDAVEFMHSLKVCHGDIKPANILLSEKVKITDFGTSRLIEDLFIETIGEGTCGFIAPEVVSSQKRYLSSDIYSLGALLYFLLTGKKVYEGLVQVINDTPYKKPCEINSNIPKKVEEVILKALTRDPDERYSTVEKLRRDLEVAISSEDKEGTVESYSFEISEHSWLEEVGKLYKEEKWQEAERFLLQQKVNGVGPDLKLHLAYVQYKQENFYNSLDILEDIEINRIEGIRQDNFEEELYFLKAKVYVALREYEKALQLYENLSMLNSDLKYKYRWAITNGLNGNLDRAIKLLEEVNQEEPGQLIVLKKLAYAYHQKKDYNKARGYFKYVSKLVPDDRGVQEKLEMYDKFLN